MDAADEEARLVAVRIRSRIEDAGLGDWEAERMLGLPAGGWAPIRDAADLGGLTPDQEGRIRAAVDLLGLLGSELPSGDVADWFRRSRDGLGGMGVLDWMEREPAALAALAAAARRARG